MTYDVQSYYKQKLRLRNSIERVFANQVNQYHHDKKGQAQGKDNSKNKQSDYNSIQPRSYDQT